MARPIDPGAVFARIRSLYRSEARVLLPPAVLLFAIQLVITLLLPVGLAALLLLLTLVLTLLYQGFVVEVVAQARVDARVSNQGDLLRAVTPALGPLLLISIILGVGVGIGLVLLIVPGLWLLTLWSVTIPVEVIERRGVFGSFGRSRELVRGNGWRVFQVIAGIYFVVFAVSLLASLIAAPLGHVGRDLIQWAVDVAVTPLVALSASVLYFDLIDANGG